VTYEFTRIKFALKLKDEEFSAKLLNSEHSSRTATHMQVLDAIVEFEKKLNKLMHNRAMIAAGALKSKSKAASIRPVDFNDEAKLVKKLITKAEDIQCKEQARKEIWNHTKEAAVSKARTLIDRRIVDRAMNLKRVEFEMATAYGSRISSWEYCWDRPNEKYVYINSDTMEVIHAKTAICEQCDTLFEQSEKKCKTCDSGRSTKSQMLYRPLGFKDIRID